ncbi:hypothetical protein IFM89_015558 [Coptis chinensis]|uniref:ASCH domain-containing protein n=1 Tax=Coptis chinensis TaxID=261450 RepID=A0A835I535_9MAGN|nr:hypothetical protein IFM89_015558 [Coptis chinensis]
MGSRSSSSGNYRNPCLTMHQPWASLLVYGIKRIEGRSWPSPIRGRLWIHAASKVPEIETIKAMEDFYREIYAVNGITDIKFPEHYPISRLLGTVFSMFFLFLFTVSRIRTRCVEVVGCVKCEELVCWEEMPEGVRLEGQTDFCWLCEKPEKLLIPFEMRGYQGVYNLERKIYDAAVRGLCPVEGPLPVKFPLPDPRDPFSLKPGILSPFISGVKPSFVEKPSNLSAAIAGARAAAIQFSKKEQTYQSNTREDVLNSSEAKQLVSNSAKDIRRPEPAFDGILYDEQSSSKGTTVATVPITRSKSHFSPQVKLVLVFAPEVVTQTSCTGKVYGTALASPKEITGYDQIHGHYSSGILYEEKARRSLRVGLPWRPSPVANGKIQPVHPPPCPSCV